MVRFTLLLAAFASLLPMPAAGQSGPVIVILEDGHCDSPDRLPLAKMVDLPPETREILDAVLPGYPPSARFEAAAARIASEHPLFLGPEGNHRLIAVLLETAERGHVPAMNELGAALLYCYWRVEQDVCAARDWLFRAYRAGDMLAGLSLGRIHLFGLGVEPDEEQGLAYLREAARAGSEDAAVLLEQYREGIISGVVSAAAGTRCEASQ